MYSPFKMKPKSPILKALVGKQNNLPAGLKAKIEAAPESPAKKVTVKARETVGTRSRARVKKERDLLEKYKKDGKKRTVGTSIYEDQRIGTGETKSTKKVEKKLLKAEKKITKAEKLSAKGKDKRAARKIKRADKKIFKASTKIRKGSNQRSVQPKYRDDYPELITPENPTGILKPLNAPAKMKKKSMAKKKVVITSPNDGITTVSRVNRKGVTRKTKTFKNAPGVTKAGKVEKFRKDGSSKKVVVKGAKTNTITKTNKKGVSKTKVKNNLKTKVKNTGKALGKAGKAVGKGIKSIPKHLDNAGYTAGLTAITGKAVMALTNPAVFTTAAMAAGMDMANSTVGAVRNQVKKNKANKKARKKAGIDKKGNPITMKKNSMAKMAKKSPSKMMKKSPSKMMKKK